MRQNGSVLLTGATGFVGSNLARHLSAAGKNVHIIVRPESDLESLQEFTHKIHLHVFDGKTETLVEIMRSTEPDCVYHLAALFAAEHQSRDVSPLVQSNVHFGVQLLEAMKEVGISALVHAGTSWQNFEGCRARPSCLYAATKEAFEVIGRYFVDAHGLSMVALRLFDSYGRGDRRRKLFWHLRTSAVHRQRLQLSAGEQMIELVYIDDLVAAFAVAGERASSNPNGTIEVFRVPSSEPLTLRQLVARYAEVTGYHLNVAWGARPYRAREVFNPWAGDPILPGWEPRIGLTQGIQLMEGFSENDLRPTDEE